MGGTPAFSGTVALRFKPVGVFVIDFPTARRRSLTRTAVIFGGLITAILLAFLVPGLVYGVVVGTIRSDKDVVRQMVSSMSHMGTYIVLVFFAARFVYSFSYSNLGLILAIDGFINMFMGSASAKWAIMAPVFVPMLMLLGYHPALTQAVFRIGDSIMIGWMLLGLPVGPDGPLHYGAAVAGR
jgi:p-aminobenzoyl-glutamate transporter AbgT